MIAKKITFNQSSFFCKCGLKFTIHKGRNDVSLRCNKCFPSHPYQYVLQSNHVPEKEYLHLAITSSNGYIESNKENNFALSLITCKQCKNPIVYKIDSGYTLSCPLQSCSNHNNALAKEEDIYGIAHRFKNGQLTFIPDSKFSYQDDDGNHMNDRNVSYSMNVNRFGIFKIVKSSVICLD